MGTLVSLLCATGALALGQLARPVAQQPPPGSMPTAAARVGALGDDEEPAKISAPPAITATAKAAPPAVAPPGAPLDKLRTADGREHVGHLLREVEGGYFFEELSGARTVIPFALITGIQRGVPAAAASPAAPPPRDELRGLRQQLTRSFDLYALEKQRAALTTGDKLLFTGAGAVLTLVGIAVSGGTGKVLRNLGLVQVGAGGVMLGVTAIQRGVLDGRIERLRGEIERPAAQGTLTLEVPLLAGRF